MIQSKLQHPKELKVMPHNYAAPRRFNDSPIAKARLAKGMTQKELAEAIGAKQAQISAWERGAIPPSVDVLVRIASALDIDVVKLMTPRNQSNNNIKELRTAKGLTQVELSKMLGIAQSTYSAYESGANEFSEEMLQRIADALEISVDDIVITTPKNPIVRYRERKKMLQSELAEKAGVSVSTITKYESGRFNPSSEILQRIADALEVSVDVLGGSDE